MLAKGANQGAGYNRVSVGFGCFLPVLVLRGSQMSTYFRNNRPRYGIRTLCEVKSMCNADGDFYAPHMAGTKPSIYLSYLTVYSIRVVYLCFVRDGIDRIVEDTLRIPAARSPPLPRVISRDHAHSAALRQTINHMVN
jgi:hypothetical protein